MLGAVHDNPGSRSVTVKVTCSCTGAWVVCKLSWGFTSKIGGHCRWKNIVTKIVFFLLLHLTGFESDLRTFWKRNNEFLGMITCHEGFSSWADTKIYGTFLGVLGFGVPGSRDFWGSQHHTFKKLRWKALRIVHLNHFEVIFEASKGAK